MKQLFYIIAILLVALQQVTGQVPQQFSYQAVLRNADGTVIANQAVDIKVTLHKTTADGTVVYTEVKSPTTNEQGVVTLSIGDGDPTSFAAIPWLEKIYLQIDMRKVGGSFIAMGTTQILSVPYSLYALSAGSVKEVASPTSAGPDDPIFVVKNKDGKIVFAVYQTGVRVYVEDSPTVKGAKGGFAVGGLSNQAKTGSTEYFRITSDSARIYINDLPGKGAKGGFAVGGLSNQAKSGSKEFLRITTDSTRIYINDLPGKGAKGGFAVGGLSNQAKSANKDYFKVTQDTSFFKTTLYTQSNIVSTGTVSTGAGTTSAPVKDKDGNSYQTVQIGQQIWMKENLKTLHDSSGNFIPPFYRTLYSGDTTTYLNTYGRLYYVSGLMNVCPYGWHVPTQLDWKELMIFVGGNEWVNNNVTTGLKLIEPGALWTTQINANNTSGFSGRPGGKYDANSGGYSGIGTAANWWEDGGFNIITLDGTSGAVAEGGVPTSPPPAYSVRCVKGLPIPTK